MILAGTPLSSFRFSAGHQTNSNIGLSGHCDMPKRTGKTFQSWAEENSVEPYVSQEEIRFAGRDLQLVGYIEGTSKIVTEGNIRALITFVDELTELEDFSSNWGTFQVLVKTIETTYVNDNLFEVKINLYEPVVVMPDELPAKDGARYGIDGVSFFQLGGGLLRVAGDFRDRPSPKQQYFTSYEKQGFQITKTEAPILSIEIYIEGVSYADFKVKINGLQALLMKPGTRLINVPNNTIREFFVTDGFKVTNMLSQNNFFGLVTIKAVELFGVGERLGYLTDNSGDYITDNYSNKIQGYGH